MVGPGDVIAGKYRLDAVLGEGGMGTVFVATNERLWKKVALKVLRPEVASSPDLAERFAREAIAASSVKHPGVVEIFDADVHEGVPWIAMQLLEGESLGARLARGPMPTPELITIVQGALDALAAVHAEGIVHRDLKPDNLFLEVGAEGPRVKLLDFGIAKLVHPEVGAQTQTGTTFGTPQFLAPEQASSSKDVDHRADLYGIGAILYHGLSGALPYEADTFGELVRQMYTAGPRPLAAVAPQVPAPLAALVDRCLAVDPNARPQSATELAQLLVQAAAGAGSQPTQAAMPRTMALSADQLKAQIAAGGSAPGAAGWHPAPATAPIAGGAAPGSSPGFGQAPRGPDAPVATPVASSSSGGGVGIAIGVVVAVLALGGLMVGLTALGGAFFWLTAREGQTEVVEVEPAYDPLAAPSVAALALPGSDADRARVPITADMPSRGPEDAAVTIVMFSDFQCPFCARVEPTLERLRRTYPEQVRVVWRDHPLAFHQNAMPAAELAREAYAQGGDDRFWQAHDLLFENQRELERPSLEAYAARLGLDVPRVRAALDGHTHQPHIEADAAAANALGARGTPGFFVNGRQLMGAQPYERFQEVVDEEIAIANALTARGLDRRHVYEHLIANGRTGPAADDDAPSRPSARRQPDPSAVYRVPLGDAPVRGNPEALVTIVAFSEFQCPFCSRVRPTLEQIEERYGSDVRIAFKHNPLPFHTNAMPAAEAAREVQAQRGDEAFWRYHDVLFENQRELTEENLVRWARDLGANVRPALSDHRHRSSIEADQQLARSIGATGTPGFFINGRNLRGAQPFAAFQAVIDEELVRARAEVARGTPRARLYDALIRDGHTSAQFVGGDAPSPAPSRPDPDQVYTIAVPRDAPSLGPASAPVTLQLFSDFQCPFCNRLRPTLEQIRERYPTQVRIVWRNYPLPFHQNAMPAAEAAMEVYAQGGDAAFWRYHDLLFENQRDLDRAGLERLAQRVGGIDMSRFRRALDAHTHRAAVEADMAAVQRAGARIGTPSTFVEGRLLQGAQPYPAFEAAIDRALNR